MSRKTVQRPAQLRCSPVGWDFYLVDDLFVCVCHLIGALLLLLADCALCRLRVARRQEHQCRLVRFRAALPRMESCAAGGRGVAELGELAAYCFLAAPTLLTTSSSSMPYSKHKWSNSSSVYERPSLAKSRSLDTPTVGILKLALVLSGRLQTAGRKWDLHWCCLASEEGAAVSPLSTCWAAVAQAVTPTLKIPSNLLHCRTFKVIKAQQEGSRPQQWTPSHWAVV